MTRWRHLWLLRPHKYISLHFNYQEWLQACTLLYTTCCKNNGISLSPWSSHLLLNLAPYQWMIHVGSIIDPLTGDSRDQGSFILLHGLMRAPWVPLIWSGVPLHQRSKSTCHWKLVTIILALILIVMSYSTHNVAHGTTAELSCHVQNCDSIWWLLFILNHIYFFMRFGWWAHKWFVIWTMENRSNHRSISYNITHKIALCSCLL